MGNILPTSRKELLIPDGKGNGGSGKIDGDGDSDGLGIGDVIPGFTQLESKVIFEARGIIDSSQLQKIIDAHNSGVGVTVNINGRLIQYEPDLPASGMTMFGEDGFLIGNEAFISNEELGKTILHELHRLNTSQSTSGVTGDLANNETQNAFNFAERAYEELNK